MRIGPMRTRVTIKRQSTAVDAYGQPIVTWTTLAAVWAAVTPLGGQERMTVGQIQASATHDVLIRWRSDVTAKQRVYIGSRVLDIESYEDPTGRRRELRLACREVLA